MEQFKLNNSLERGEERENNIVKKLAQRIREIFKENPKEVEPEKKEELNNFYEEGFDVYEALKQVKGPYIEVAGPTEGGYMLIETEKLGRKLTISNQSASWAKGKIDFEANATDLPMKDGSIGALFISCLGGMQKDDSEELKKLEFKSRFSKKESALYEKLSYESKRRLRDGALQEAFRVLEDKGLLIWQGGEKEDYIKALELGFALKVLKDDRRVGVAYSKLGYNYIFEKEKMYVKKSSSLE